MLMDIVESHDKRFLGNHRAENTEHLVNDLLNAYNMMGCPMSLKNNFPHSYFSFIPSSLVAVIDEQRERFHENMKRIEERFQGR